MCEEFACLPSQLEDESPDLLMRIALLRDYARSKQRIDAAGDSQPEGISPSMATIWGEVMRVKLARTSQTEGGE